jgi:hypothetical protein
VKNYDRTQQLIPEGKRFNAICLSYIFSENNEIIYLKNHIEFGGMRFMGGNRLDTLGGRLSANGLHKAELGFGAPGIAEPQLCSSELQFNTPIRRLAFPGKKIGNAQ